MKPETKSTVRKKWVTSCGIDAVIQQNIRTGVGLKVRYSVYLTGHLFIPDRSSPLNYFNGLNVSHPILQNLLVHNGLCYSEEKLNAELDGYVYGWWIGFSSVGRTAELDEFDLRNNGLEKVSKNMLHYLDDLTYIMQQCELLAHQVSLTAETFERTAATLREVFKIAYDAKDKPR